jgi:hypothetical protein
MPWRYVMEWRFNSTYSLTSALDGVKWSASRPGRFTHWGALRTPCIGRWVGVEDAVGKGRILPLPGTEPGFLGRPGRNLLLYRLKCLGSCCSNQLVSVEIGYYGNDKPGNTECSRNVWKKIVYGKPFVMRREIVSSFIILKFRVLCWYQRLRMRE